MVLVSMRRLSIQLQFVKENHYRSKYGPQHRGLADNEQQAIKEPNISNVK